MADWVGAGPIGSAIPRTSEALVAVDAHQRIVAWNRQAERVFGRSAGEVLGAHCYQVLAATDRRGRRFCRESCPVMSLARVGGAPPPLRLRARGWNGDRVAMDVSTIILTSSRGVGPVIHLCRQTAGEPLALHLERCDDGVTRREREVLEALCRGETTSAIAEEFGVSTTTVRNHVQHLLAKFGAHSRSELVALAFRDGFGP